LAHFTRWNEDADLTRIKGKKGAAQGTLIILKSTVRDESGKAVSFAKIDCWQTNGFGAYHHPADESGNPRDPNFQGGAIFKANAQGQFLLRTVMPQPYSDRQRHIHFDIRGKNRRLITQMFFAGEPNEKDRLYMAVDEARRPLLTAQPLPDENGWKVFGWDIWLSGE
jgi:protocatechuate 3,4-dioxygenase, beta subunit